MDISKIKDPVIAEHYSEQKHRALLQNLNEVVYVLDKDAKIQYVSPNILELGGYSADEVNQKNFVEFVHPDDRKGRAGAFRKALTGGNETTEYRFLRKDGQVAWVTTNAKPLIKDGKFIGIQGVLVEITKRKEAERRLEESEKNFRTFFETIDDLIFVCDLRKRIYYANNAAISKLGYSISQLKEMFIQDFYAADKQMLVEQMLESVLAGNKGLCSAPLTTRDGSYLPVDTRIWVGEWDGKRCVFWGSKDLSREQEVMQKFDRLFENNSALMAVNAFPQKYFTEVNAAFTKKLGYSKMEVIGRTPADLNIFYELGGQDRIGDAFGKDGKVHDLEVRLKTKDGQIFHGLFSGEIIKSRGREYFLSVIIDTTYRKKVEGFLEAEKELFKTTLLSVGDAVISTDDRGHIKVMNKIAEDLTGWDLEAALGRPLKEVFKIIRENAGEELVDVAEKVLQTGDTIGLGNDTILISRTGREIPIEDSAAPIKDGTGRVLGVVIVFRDFTEKKEKQKRIEYLSFYDYLTGLYNRRYIDHVLKRLDTQANLPLGLMVVDVDGLKLTNDVFGHETGDRLLKAVAKTLRKVCRADDIIGRIGGDEFLIIFPNTGPEQVGKIKQRIIAAIAKVRLDSVVISLAIGYAVKTAIEENLNNIRKNADDQMYKNKVRYGRGMKSKTIEKIIKSINDRYGQEQVHTEQVSYYCEAIARALNLSEKESCDIKTMGVLHDIGKIIVPPEILKKQGELTAEEFRLLKRHPETGYQILRSVPEYAALADSVLYHHEWWDGTGYPAGLKGEEIPLGSRIIAVADAYEAMTSKRLYQKTRTKEEAIAELRKYAGIQFAPDIVEVFVEKVL